MPSYKKNGNSEVPKSIQQGDYFQKSENGSKKPSPFDDLGKFTRKNLDVVGDGKIVSTSEETAEEKERTDGLLSGEIEKISKTKGYFTVA